MWLTDLANNKSGTLPLIKRPIRWEDATTASDAYLADDCTSVYDADGLVNSSFGP
jgi:hypothetical protein